MGMWFYSKYLVGSKLSFSRMMCVRNNECFTEKFIFGSFLVAFSMLAHKTNAHLTDVAYRLGANKDVNDHTPLDGDMDTCMVHSSETESLWWRLNLEDWYIIQQIRVYGCLNECGHVVATVSMHDDIYQMFDAIPEVINNTYQMFEPVTPMGGRYVKLSMGLPGTLSFCEVEVLVQDRDPLYLKSRPGVINDGWAIVNKTIPVVSDYQCAYLCMRNKMCNGVNVIQGVTSSVEMECQLLGPEHFNLDNHTGAIYWEVDFF